MVKSLKVIGSYMALTVKQIQELYGQFVCHISSTDYKRLSAKKKKKNAKQRIKRTTVTVAIAIHVQVQIYRITGLLAS